MKIYLFPLYVATSLCAMENDAPWFPFSKVPHGKLIRTKKEKEHSAQLAKALTELPYSASLLKKLTVTAAYMDDVFEKYRNPYYKKQ